MDLPSLITLLPSVPSLLGGHFRAPQSGEIRLVQKRHAQRYANPDVQGDTFVINVYDKLHDKSMDRATSIVSIQDREEGKLLMSTYSIGTVLTSIPTTLSMVLPLSLSVLSYQTMRSNTSSMFHTKR